MSLRYPDEPIEKDILINSHFSALIEDLKRLSFNFFDEPYETKFVSICIDEILFQAKRIVSDIETAQAGLDEQLSFHLGG